MFVGAFFRTRSIHTPSSPASLSVLDSSLACFFVYTWAKVCGRSFFRTRNHTLHSPVYLCICVGGLRVWGFRYVCGRVFCVRLIFSVLLSLHLCDSLWPLFFRTSNIHTLHSLVICVRRLSVWGFRYVVGARFLKRGIFTPFSPVSLC